MTFQQLTAPIHCCDQYSPPDSLTVSQWLPPFSSSFPLLDWPHSRLLVAGKLSTLISELCALFLI